MVYGSLSKLQHFIQQSKSFHGVSVSKTIKLSKKKCVKVNPKRNYILIFLKRNCQIRLFLRQEKHTLD